MGLAPALDCRAAAGQRRAAAGLSNAGPSRIIDPTDPAIIRLETMSDADREKLIDRLLAMSPKSKGA